MDFIREDDTIKGVIKALDGVQEVGRLTYLWSGSNRILIDHTEIFGAYQGKGLGKELVESAVSFARENDIKIIPLCSFARKVIEGDPKNREVLYQQES
jgi:predicted GNAT family acetyltransferase